MKMADQGRQLAEMLHRIKAINFWSLVPDLTPAEIQLLAAICGCGESEPKISDLYDVCGMQPAAVSRLLNSLEEKGLILRSARKGNRRITNVSATDLGTKINAENLKILHGYWENVLARLSPEDIDTMIRIQSEMMDTMESVLAEQASGKPGGKQ